LTTQDYLTLIKGELNSIESSLRNISFALTKITEPKSQLELFDEEDRSVIDQPVFARYTVGNVEINGFTYIDDQPPVMLQSAIAELDKQVAALAERENNHAELARE
jgi:hypothetical protein